MLSKGFDESKTVDESEENKVITAGMKDPKSVIFQEYQDYVANHGKIMEIMERVAAENGMTRGELIKAFQGKEPMKRSVEEQNACVSLRRAFEKELFPDEKVHEEQSVQQGKDVAADNGLGTEKPNGEAVKQELNNLSEAEKELDQFIEDNDVFGQNYKKLKDQGLTNPQIYQWFIDNGLTEDDLIPFAKYINANARVQGMQHATQQKIEEKVSAYVQDWRHHGTFNGQESNGEQVVWVQGEDGRMLVVGSGDMAFDSTTGKAKEGVGDMLVCFDPNAGETVCVKAKDVTLFQTQKPEDFGNEYRQKLQNINSQAYAEAAAAQGEGAAQEEGESKAQTETGKKQEGQLKQESPELYKVAKSLQNKVGQSLSKEEADGLVSEMEERAEPARELELTPENWTAEFGEDGIVSTPFGEVKMGENQYLKIAQLGRRGKLGMVKPTLENPDVIIEDASQAKEGDTAERNSSYIFVKSFVGKDGERMYHFASVTVQKDGKEVVISNQEKSANRIKKLMQEGKVVFVKGEPSLHPKTQMEESVPRSDSQGSTSSDNQTLGLGINSPELSTSKDKNKTSNMQEGGGSLTFADGTAVPVDAKGEPDFMQMSAEDGARFYEENFDKDAEKQLDSDIKDMEKVLKAAKSAKVKGKTMTEKIASRKANQEAVAIAEAQLEKAREIKKAMTARKVAEAMTKPETKPAEQNTEAQTEAERRFVEAPKVEGRRGTITLPNSEKIKGRYVAVPASVLIPSHDPFNGYKPHEGVPLDENGHTVNDRDYENDKDAQAFTETMAADYGGQALMDVPVVNPNGRTLSGNGRTMAGQIAAKKGTDGKYVEARNENAGGFGMKAEDLDKLDHARIVFIPDEPLPYDTATFAKFNRNEKKTQSNTQQAVANSKKLSADEVGAIISEIEGSGSLDAFFNNSKAINDLIKTLKNKDIIGQNDVAELLEANGERLSAQGKEMVKNLLLGGIFKEETIRMLGIDGGLKTKALNGIRSVMENMKLGEYSLRDEIDGAIKLLYEAKRSKMTVDDYLRQDNVFEASARDKYSQVTQAIAQALEGNASLFRDLMAEYNNIAKVRNTGEADVFGENLSHEELVKQFLEVSKVIKENEIKLYGNKEGHQNGEGGNHAASHEEPAKEAGGAVGEERQVNDATHKIVDDAGYKAAVEQLKTAEGEERERILDSMEDYVKEYAREHGYDEPAILRTTKDMADAAKTEGDRSLIENIPEGRHLPGYYEDGKVYICLEQGTDSAMLRETFEHESVHADNANDPSRVEMLVASVEDTHELTRGELESVVEMVANTTHYTDAAAKMKDTDALRMLADEALAHLVTYAYKHGVDAMSEITDNPTLLNIAKQAFKERENDRQRKQGLDAVRDTARERQNVDVLSAEGDHRTVEQNPQGKPGDVGGNGSDKDVSDRKGTEEVSKPQRQVDEALKTIATEITKQTGVEVVTDEKAGQRALEDVESNGVEIKKQAMLSGLTKAAKAIKTWLKDGKRGKVFSIDLPSATQAMIRKEMGRDFDSHNITANGVAHAKKNHGEDGTKLSENSIPLRDEDFELLPYIMTAPDYVKEGSTDVTGRRSIRFYKELSNGYVVVAEKEYKNSPDDMETITMWAEMSDKATNAQRNAALDTHVRNAILDIDAAKIRKDAETAIENDAKIHKQKVYHGSQADFDHFDHSFMNSGEGAQAYGWGTYVSEVEGIARSYAVKNAKKHSGATYAEWNDYYEANVSYVNKKAYYELAVANVQFLKRSIADKNLSDDLHDYYEKSLKDKEAEVLTLRGEMLEAKARSEEAERVYNEAENKKPVRNLYTVEIPDDTGDNYLGWDKDFAGRKLYSTLDRISNALRLKGIDLNKPVGGINLVHT